MHTSFMQNRRNTFVKLIRQMFSTIMQLNSRVHDIKHSSPPARAVLLVLLRWQEFTTRSMAVFCLTYHRGGGGEYPNIGAVCTMHCGWGSIICPIPFPSCLIMLHTSTAAVVVNNTTTWRDRYGGRSRDRSLRQSSGSTEHKWTEGQLNFSALV